MSRRVPGVGSFWAAEANYAAAPDLEGYPVRPYPVVFQIPVRALVGEGDPVVLHRHARTLTVSCELAFVLGDAAYCLSESEAAARVQEYRVMAAFRDLSTLDYIGPDAPAREAYMWSRIARWADDSHCLGARVRPADAGFPAAGAMRLAVDGAGEVGGDTAAYLHRAAAVIAMLSRSITLQAGDVFSLGRAGEALTIPAELRLEQGARVSASIEGVGTLTTAIRDLRQPGEARPSDLWWL
jgi:2-keto-4-pentenoate hydratase/2-oxohepta-3-ene-1,7-dioic acid hydratase in catechol pathway